MRRRISYVFGLLAAATLLAPASARAQSWGQFGVDVLPLPPGLYNFGLGGMVNDAGQVAGARVNGFIFEAFLFDPGTGTVNGLGHLAPGWSSYGRGINNAGQVTGFGEVGTGIVQAFRSDGPGQPLEALGTLGGATSEGIGINDAGQVTGRSRNASAQQQAFRSDGPGQPMEGVPSLGGTSSVGYDINEAGQIAGQGFDASGRPQAFRSDGPGLVAGLGFLDPLSSSRFSVGLAINEAGQVAGESRNASGQQQAFLSGGPGTTMEALDMMGGNLSSARGISDAGQVVGYAAGGSLATWRATLWEGGMGYFLDALSSFAGSGWTFYEARGMSGGGTVLVYGANAAVNGGANTYAVLRQRPDPGTVVPEPSTWLLLATGLVGIGVAARRRREGEGAYR